MTGFKNFFKKNKRCAFIISFSLVFRLLNSPGYKLRNQMRVECTIHVPVFLDFDVEGLKAASPAMKGSAVSTTNWGGFCCCLWFWLWCQPGRLIHWAVSLVLSVIEWNFATAGIFQLVFELYSNTHSYLFHNTEWAQTWALRTHQLFFLFLFLWLLPVKYEKQWQLSLRMLAAWRYFETFWHARWDYLKSLFEKVCIV